MLEYMDRETRRLYYSIMRAQDLSIHTKALRTKDGRLPPEPVLGDPVMSGRFLISGRHLILTLPLVRKMQRNTGENERNRLLGCLVKTRNRVKNPSREKPRT